MHIKYKRIDCTLLFLVMNYLKMKIHIILPNTNVFKLYHFLIIILCSLLIFILLKINILCQIWPKLSYILKK